MKKLILIGGKAFNGKSSFADCCQLYLEKSGYKVSRMLFAKYLKQLSQEHFGWDGEKNEEGRHILQYVGTDLIRDKLGWKNFHATRICEDITIVQDKYDFVIIDDMRFLNEHKVPKSIFRDRLITVCIDSSENRGNLTREQLNHRSENELNDFKYDVTVTNNNTMNDLLVKAELFCEGYLLDEGDVDD